MKIATINGFRFIRLSPLSEGGCLHGFGTRDLGLRAVQAHARIKETFSGVEEVATVHQVHGRRAVRVRSGQEVAGLRRVHADIMVVDTPGIAAAVRTADCAPLLIHDPKRNVAAAVHAGWKGTVERAAEEAVRVLAREYRSQPNDLVAGVGPCIGPCHYQVDEPVIRGIRRSLGGRAEEVLLPDVPGRKKLDLSLANRVILEEAGVLPDRIEEARACTFCNPGLFYSYRREGKGVSSLYHIIAPGG